MDYVRKIPLLLGTGAGLITGLIGLSAGVPNKQNMLNMCVGMVVFYIVGILIRSTIRDISEYVMELARKKEEEEQKLKKEVSSREAGEKKEEQAAPGIDLKVGNESGQEDEDFEDLRIAEFIKNELK